MKRLVIINMSIGMTPSLTESVYINLRASWKLGRFEFGASSWKYHRNQECVRVRVVRGARGARRPTTSAVKVGRVAPRARVVGKPWYRRPAPGSARAGMPAVPAAGTAGTAAKLSRNRHRAGENRGWREKRNSRVWRRRVQGADTSTR